MYVCKTFDKKLKQNLIPEQSVKNSLGIDDFPPELQGICRLERVFWTIKVGIFISFRHINQYWTAIEASMTAQTYKIWSLKDRFFEFFNWTFFYFSLWFFVCFILFAFHFPFIFINILSNFFLLVIKFSLFSAILISKFYFLFALLKLVIFTTFIIAIFSLQFAGLLQQY